MLASDLNNPEFVGAMNPDDVLHVEFYWNEPIDQWASREASEAAGRNVVVKGPKQPFIMIARPGDATTIIREAVEERHKARFPQKWLYFQMQEGLIDEGKDIPGWKIDDWDEIKGTPELVRGLKFARFHTVEQIAGASDAQVAGMGMGGLGLRERAKAALRAHMNQGTADAIAARDKIIADQGAALKQLQEQMAALMGKKDDAPSAEAEQPAPKRRGRPPKQEPAQEVAGEI